MSSAYISNSLFFFVLIFGYQLFGNDLDIKSSPQNTVQDSFYPDFMQKRITTSNGKGIILFDTSGVNAIDTTDSNGNSIPDFIEYVDSAFVRSWFFEIDSLGHKEPLLIEGWHLPFPIYIQENSELYGATYFVQPGVQNGEFTRFPSYMQINPHMERLLPVDDINDALRVTIAHELYHAIQLSYGIRFQDGNFADLWLLEATATAFEEFVYDEVNDYYQHLDKLQSLPWSKGLIRSFADAYYGNAIFYIMISEQLGHLDFMIDIWQEQFEYPGEEIVERIVQINGLDFNNIIGDYSIWRYFTGSKWQAGFYSEGMNYPEISFFEPISVTDIFPHNNIENWGFEIHYFETVEAVSISINDYPFMIYNTISEKMDWFNKGKSAILEPNDSYLIVIWDADLPFNFSTFEGELKYAFPNPALIKIHDIVTILGCRTEEQVDIFNIVGQKIIRLKADSNGALHWDFKDSRGVIVGSGLYIFYLNSSKTKVKSLILK